MQTEKVIEEIKQKNPEQQQFHQLILEIFKYIRPVLENNAKYREARIWERMLEPERVISFRICWTDDAGNIQINRGYRVQMSSAIGPYKGGLRFHPSVNLDTFKFLALEQTFKNALTTLPLGAGKGGADFDPKGKSGQEIMRFCQAMMGELHRHIGPELDIPAGDMGVSTREIGYLFGAYKKISNRFNGVLTGKDVNWGGSLIRPEATGYGLVYFCRAMLRKADEGLKGKRCLLSGAGNVSLHAADMLLQQGASVMGLSDSQGYIHAEEGLTHEQLKQIVRIKRVEHQSLEKLAAQDKKVRYQAWEQDEGQGFWEIPADLALPCATQNEIGKQEAEKILKNDIMLLAEGANMPLDAEASDLLSAADILYAPGKASNAGGVAVSGLEMSQNSSHTYWSQEEVNSRLEKIMLQIHEQCLEAAARYGMEGNYRAGANIAGFEKVAEAMLAQGII